MPLADLLQQFITLVAVFGFQMVPSLSVFIIMYMTLILIGFFMNLKPFNEKSTLNIVLFNLSSMLYLSYLQLLFTDFVDQSVSDDAGN